MITESKADHSNNDTDCRQRHNQNAVGAANLSPAAQGPNNQARQKSTDTKTQGIKQTPKRFNWYAGVTTFAAVLSAGFSALMYQSATDANKVAVISANAAQRSAVSAETAVADAREHSHAELRAYLTVTDARVTGLDTRQPKVVLTIKNVGETPSKATYLITDAFCDTYPPSDVKLWGMEKTALQVGDGHWFTLASGQQITTEGHKVDTYNREGLRSKREAIYAKGVVYYTDVFGYQCEEHFSLIQGGLYDWNAESMGVYDPQP